MRFSRSIGRGDAVCVGWLVVGWTDVLRPAVR